MSILAPSLVRVQDRFAAGRDESPVWRINPRTAFLETRAGLSWTGVREYRTADGVMRVLRRPEQVNAPGHLKTLRLLPASDGHPAGDVDVTAANSSLLKVGGVGDLIDVEDFNGYPRPVGNITVHKPRTIVKMVDAETWQTYCRRFRDLAQQVAHSGAAPATGTSLGYNALWYGPYVDAEIVGEHENGEGLIGSWQGPHGPELYDIEHVVDPDCEIVQRLVRDAGFDAEQLGGNHFAVALAELCGRGGAQSELMRIVDSREVRIPFDLTRRKTRCSVQIPAQVRDMKWTVGTDRELPVVPGEWDGAAAAASVFDWAGWPDNPKPEQARRAFLIYDSDAPELKGSYKLPIAEYRDGGLVVLKGGLDAAASRLPQTDAPRDVLERARAVLDRYYEKFQKQAASRDARIRTVNTRQIEIGLGRDAFATLTKSGALARCIKDKINVPQTQSLLVPVSDEIDGKAFMSKLEELQSFIGSMVEMLAEQMGMVEGMQSEMSDMMPKEELAKAIEAKQAEIDALKAEMAKAADASKAVADERDALVKEVEPLRDAALAALRQTAVAFGVDDSKIASAKDSAEVRRLIVQTKAVDGDVRYAVGKASDDLITHVFDGLMLASPAIAAEASRDIGDDAFRQIPTLAQPRQTSDADRTRAQRAADDLAAGFAAFG